MSKNERGKEQRNMMGELQVVASGCTPIAAVFGGGGYKCINLEGFFKMLISVARGVAMGFWSFAGSRAAFPHFLKLSLYCRHSSVIALEIHELF